MARNNLKLKLKEPIDIRKISNKRFYFKITNNLGYKWVPRFGHSRATKKQCG